MTDIISELRDHYPAVDVTEVVFSRDFAGVGCCVIPQEKVLAIIGHIEALTEFFKWAMREGPWDGCDLDGGSMQDKAEALGLIVKTQYDAEKHGVQSDFEDGDDWFEYAPHILSPVGGKR